MTVTKKPDHRGEHEVSRKTIAQGRPECSGEPVVITLVCFLLCTRGCGCTGHPAFPAPSVIEGRRVSCTVRAQPCRGIADACLSVIARSTCDEAIHLSSRRAARWIASLRSQ